MNSFRGGIWSVSYNFSSFWSFGVPKRSNIGLIDVSYGVNRVVFSIQHQGWNFDSSDIVDLINFRIAPDGA